MSFYPALLLPYPNLCFQPPVLPCTPGSRAWAWLFLGLLREWAVLAVVHAMPEMLSVERVFFVGQRSAGLLQKEPKFFKKKKKVSHQHQGYSNM